MTVNRKFWRVYSRTAWASGWVRRPYLEIISFSAGKPPAVGKAALVYRYGKGEWEDAVDMTDGTLITDFSGHYIAITQSDNVAGLNETTKFMGHVPQQDFIPLGYSVAEDVAAADQIITAYAVDYLLGASKMTGAWVTEDGTTAKFIDQTVEFNNRLANGRIEGNRSEFPFTYEGSEGYAFDGREEGREVWSIWEILDYLRTRHRPATGPAFIFPAAYYEYPRPKAVISLDDMKVVYDYKGKSLRDALNELVAPNRGFGWGVRYNTTTGNFEINIWSMLETAVTVGAITIPAHDAGDREEVSLWNNANDQLTITKEDANYDKIVVEGAPIKVCGTFWADRGTDEFVEGQLVKGWTSTKETAYKDAAKNSEGYDKKETDEKALINDLYRTSERFEEVFTSFVVPEDFDWKVGNGPQPGDLDILNLLFDREACDFVLGEQGAYWNGQKRFLAYLPLKEGWDYSGAEPVDLSPAGAEDKYRKILAVAIHNSGKFVNLEKNPDITARVQPMLNRFGVTIRFNPSHIMAKADWDGAEPSQWDDSLSAFGFDWRSLAVTAMVETDQMLAAEYTIRAAENMRVLTINLPYAELWDIIPDTVIDIDENGTPVLFPLTADTNLRDDRELILSALAAAAAYYSRPKYKITFTSFDFEWDIYLGKMLTGFNIEGDGSRGGCISAITWNVKEGTITIQTDSAELDFGVLAGAATATAAGEKHTATRRGSTQITEVRHGLESLRQEVMTAMGGRPAATKTDEIRFGKITEGLGPDQIFIGQLYDGDWLPIEGSAIEVTCDIADIAFVEVGQDFCATKRYNKWWCIGLYEPETPTSYPSGETPTSYPSGETPTSYPSGETPTSYPTGETPTSYPTGETPTSGPPTSEPSSGPPTSEPSSGPPTSEPSSGPPTSEPSGPGWYCIKMDSWINGDPDEDCSGEPTFSSTYCDYFNEYPSKNCSQYLGPPEYQHDTVTVLSGPYDTEWECQAACPS